VTVETMDRDAELAFIDAELERTREDSAARRRAADEALGPRPDPLPPNEQTELERSILLGRPYCRVERVGPSYRATIGDATFLFRDVRTDRDLTADVTVMAGARHLFRSTATLSLAGRDKIAKVAADLAGDKPDQWRRATFAAVEAVMEAEEQLGQPVDLRTATLELPVGGTHLLARLWPVGSVALTAPGDAGKSTITRALGVSLAHATTVIPGVDPIGGPRPVLYVAAEDSVSYWHARSVEAICRGVGVNRRDLAEPIELFDARGRPLHRIARALAERAADFGAIVLDSQQALLAMIDAGGGIRDRDTLFWQAADQIECPVLVIAHPNRADARDWQKADGRIAGSEVNRDRVRMAWRATWRDEPAVSGTSFRAYTLTNTKNNHGPKEAPIGFAAAWQFGMGSDSGVLTFTRTEPHHEDAPLSPQLAEALAAYREGFTTPTPLAGKLGIGTDTAKSRLRLLKDRGLLEGSENAA
jgi:hypothetical protein